MHDDLLGYLIEALDPEEKNAVDAYLRAHPEARQHLAPLRRALDLLDQDKERTDVDPPSDLRLNTLAKVAEHMCRTLPTAPRVSPRQADGRRRRYPRWADMLVAALILILVGGIFFPMVANLWTRSHVKACQENMRTMWVAFQDYSNLYEGNLPQVHEPPLAAAGVFIPILHEARVLPDNVSVGCPAQGKKPPPPTTTTELVKLYHESDDLFRNRARELAGDYAYTLGYRENGLLRGPHRDLGDHVPLLSDVPPGQTGNSTNHHGTGQNVLFIGGHVQWITARELGPDDDIFLNRERRVKAGVDREDTVLGPGDASPIR